MLVIDYPYGNSAEGDKAPPSSAADHVTRETRERIKPPTANYNYLPEQLKKDEPDFKLREGLKPLHVIQPEGVSYRLEGRVINWQNWQFHIGFSHREGLVLSNITYDDGKNGVRPIFYRLSIAEMVVPVSIIDCVEGAPLKVSMPRLSTPTTASTLLTLGSTVSVLFLTRWLSDVTAWAASATSTPTSSHQMVVFKPSKVRSAFSGLRTSCPCFQVNVQ